MPRTTLSTRTLLVCAAIGVATGLLGAAAGWITIAVLATVPVVYGFVLGAHVLPGVIAQRLLRLPGVAIATHVLASLVSSAFAPMYVWQFVATAVLFGGIQEASAALGRYRSWSPVRSLATAVVIGAVVAVAVAFAADLGSLAPWAQALYIALGVAGPIGWTIAGLSVAAALGRAGLAQSTEARIRSPREG
ncbi:ECF transporter S component [Microbacterium sp. JZ31]|uniref:ECF transporter S component n=1 Tax=Microbacterium sp. JZ31 TaxID=1906274 RepID=UPI0019336EC1|nr:ECF transporter S component [Microbacterium sp. JZ31]